MILKFSRVKKIPYVEYDKDNRMIFTTTVTDEHGFKYLSFKVNTTATVMVSGGKKGKGKRKPTEVSEEFNFMTGVDMNGIPRDAKKSEFLSPGNLKYLKGILIRYTVNDVIPFASVKSIGDELRLDKEIEVEQENETEEGTIFCELEKKEISMQSCMELRKCDKDCDEFQSRE